MTERRKKAIKQIVFGVVLLVVAGTAYWYGNRVPEIVSFAECAEAGYPVMESYPRQCKTPEGEIFKEYIGNELEKDELIRISEPRPNAVVTSPLTVKGMARGNWFFEGSFAVRLFDGNGEMLARGIATAKGTPARISGTEIRTGTWMTDAFVPFEGVITFDGKLASGSIGKGILVLKKENPSGLPEHDDALEIPVRFR